MKEVLPTLCFSIVLTAAAIFAAPFAASSAGAVHAQSSRISGYVTGVNRQPMDKLYIELLDDFGRTIRRTATNGSGYYSFEGLRDGRYTVRVLTLGTDYQDAENSVEISNLTGGFVFEQSDFSLRLRRGVTPQTGAIFVQEVPADAQKLYDKAVEDLQNKRREEAHDKLRSAISAFPKYFAALELLGLEYIELGRPEAYQAADVLLNMAVEINPRSFRGWFGLAYARHAIRNYAEAAKAIEKAIELQSGSADAALLHGRILRGAKKYAEAEKQLIRAKQLYGEGRPQVHWELALLYGHDLKNYEAAATELKLYLKINPNAANAEDVKRLIATFESKKK